MKNILKIAAVLLAIVGSLAVLGRIIDATSWKITRDEIKPIAASTYQLFELIKKGDLSEERRKQLGDRSDELRKLMVGLSTSPDINGLKPKLTEEITNTIAYLNEAKSDLEIGDKTRLPLIAELNNKLESLKAKLDRDLPLEKGSGGWVVDFLIAFSWPLFAVMIFMYLTTSPNAEAQIKKLFSPFKSGELFGFKFELNAEQSRQARENLKEAFDAYRKQVVVEYDRWAEEGQLAHKLSLVLTENVIPYFRNKGMSDADINFRCTVHVRDLLFSDTFYQLLSYHKVGNDPGWSGVAGEDRGRTWPIRFGFIGLRWRLQESDVKGDIPVNVEGLIRDWGMTATEAHEAGNGRKSFAGIVLNDAAKEIVGIFYMDGFGKDVFGTDTKEVETRIRDACDAKGLTQALAKINDNFKGRALRLHLYNR